MIEEKVKMFKERGKTVPWNIVSRSQKVTLWAHSRSRIRPFIDYMNNEYKPSRLYKNKFMAYS